MDKKILSWLLVALIILSVSVVPVSAWTYPDCTEDDKYELFGPRADRYLISLFADEESEWAALEAHQIDIGDWPLTKDKVQLYSSPPYSDYIKLHNYGAEYGFRVIDLNNNPNPYLGNPQNPAYPNPVYPNPMSVSSFRHAIAHLVDRDFIIAQYWGGLGVPMYTELVPSQAGVHPEIRPGGALADLTHPYSPTEAANILTADGFVDTDGNGWRNFPVAIGGDGNDVVLKFYIRSDDTRRKNLGNWLADQLEADPVKIKVDRIYKTSYGCWLDVMVAKNFHMYTGGWGVGVDPDTGDLYSIDYYWHPGFCYNYDAVNCTEFEYWHKKVIYGNTYEEVLEAVLHEQEAFCTPSCIGAIPVLAMGPSIQPQHRTYTGNEPGEEGYYGQRWNGIVNIVGYGPDSYWSLLNMYPECSPMGDCEHMTIRRGFKVAEVKKLNPVYAEWTWDWEVLGVIYDSLGYRNPYNLLEWKPFLIERYEAFSWVDPSDGQTKSAMRFTLRNDIQWNDGVPFSAADIEYTLVEFPKKLIKAGYPPPWWWSSVRYIKSFFQIDPCNIEILLDIKTYFAIGWILGGSILPKHIWDPILDRNIAHTNPSYEQIEGFAPDPNLIGTGPYRLVNYVGQNYISMVAHKPAQTVKTNLEGSVPITSGAGFFLRYPIDIKVYNVENYPRQKIPAGSTSTYRVVLHNKWLNPIPNTAGAPNHGTLIVEKTVILVDYTTTPPTETTLATGTVTLPPCEDYVEDFTLTINRCHYAIKVIVHIVGPEEIECMKNGEVIMKPNPWISWTKTYEWHFWVTIKEDIGGAWWDTWHDKSVMPDGKDRKEVPTPDCKVDMKDIGAAAKSFGSYPGHIRWNSIADIDGNYKVEMKDIGAIAKKFGW